MKYLLLFLLRIYKVFLSPLLIDSCRFVPTCSEYSYEAINKHGAVRGSLMTAKRLLSCHPFNAGGYDPVE